MDVNRPTLDSTNTNAVSQQQLQRPSSPTALNNNSSTTSIIEQANPPLAEYWCHTQVRITKMKYIWTISNFSFCREEMGEIVKSSIFSAGSNDKLKWGLRINPKGLDEDSREYLSLYLLLVNSGSKTEARAKFRFSILNARRDETKAMESQRAYRFVQGKDWGFKKFIRRDVLMDESNGLLPNDQLTILCEVSVVGETLSESGQINNQQIVVPECSLHDDIGNMLYKQLFTDVTLVVVSRTAQSNYSCIRSQYAHHSNSSSSNNAISTMNATSNEAASSTSSFDFKQPYSLATVAGAATEATDSLNTATAAIVVATAAADDDEDDEDGEVNEEDFRYGFDDEQEISEEDAIGALNLDASNNRVTASSQTHEDEEEHGEAAVELRTISADESSSSSSSSSSSNCSTPNWKAKSNSATSGRSKSGLVNIREEKGRSPPSNARLQKTTISSAAKKVSTTTTAAIIKPIVIKPPAQKSHVSQSTGGNDEDEDEDDDDRDVNNISAVQDQADSKFRQCSFQDSSSSTVVMATSSTTFKEESLAAAAAAAASVVVHQVLPSQQETTVLKTFQAHKAILAARSPVFAAMFEHSMEESRANRVEISDMDPETVAEVLRYIYTGQVMAMDKLAPELLAAADKYQLDRLKSMCEDALVEGLCIENACDTLGLADMHNAEQLKMHTLDFIMLHALEICSTEGYDDLARHRPHLLNECFRSLASQHLPLRCSSRKRPRPS